MSFKEGVNVIELDKWTVPALRSECVKVFGDESLSSAARLPLIQKLCVNTNRKYKNVYENWTTSAQKKELQARGESTSGDADALIARLRATCTPAKKHLDEVVAKSSPSNVTPVVSKRSQSAKFAAAIAAASASSPSQQQQQTPTKSLRTRTTSSNSTSKMTTASAAAATETVTSAAAAASPPILKSALKSASPTPTTKKPLKSILSTKNTPQKNSSKKHRLNTSTDDNNNDNDLITPPIDNDSNNNQHRIEMHSEPPRKKHRRQSTLAADAISPSDRRRSVGFGDVEIREYARRHGGGGGVPHDGAYPLGLDWKVEADHVESLAEYERQRIGTRHDSDHLPHIDEQHRKAILEKTDARPSLERAASYVLARRELQSLRSARKSIGCSCHSNAADSSDKICSKETDCRCFSEQLECCVETCNCDLSICSNPYKDRVEYN